LFNASVEATSIYFSHHRLFSVVTPPNPYVHQPAPTATKTVPNHYVALYDYETAIDSLPFSKVR
jgi:hypothetical protein